MRSVIVWVFAISAWIGCVDEVPVEGGWVEPEGTDRGVLEPGEECLEVSFNDSFTLDLRTVELTVDVTLNGEPVSAANTSAEAFGRLFVGTFRPGEAISPPGDGWWSNNLALDLWDRGYPGPWTLQVPAGIPLSVAYSCARSVGGAVYGGCGEWPINERVVLESGLVFDEDSTLVLDIESADLVFELRLQGAPITEADLPEVIGGSLTAQRADEWLLRQAELTREQLLSPPFTFDGKVLPGSYEVRLEDLWEGPGWRYAPPIGLVTVPHTGVPDAADIVPAEVVDIPLTITFGGRAWADLGVDVSFAPIEGWPRLYFIGNDVDARWGDIGSLWGGPMTLPPGSYRVVLNDGVDDRHLPDAVGTSLPWNIGATVTESLSLTGGAVALDIPVVQFGVELTYGGGTDLGGILRLTSTGALGTVTIPVWPGEPTVAAALPGEYEVVLESTQVWPRPPPLDERPLHMSVVSLGTHTIDGQDLRFEIPLAEVDVDLVHDGELVSEDSGVTNPHLFLTSDAGHTTEILATGPEDVRADGTLNGLRLVPATYRVELSRFSDWPGAAGVLEVDDGGEYTLDFRPRHMTLDVRVNGAPLDASNGAEAGLRFRSRAPGRVFRGGMEVFDAGLQPISSRPWSALPTVVDVSILGGVETPWVPFTIVDYACVSVR